MLQENLFTAESTEFGGDLRRTRAGRAHGRPVAGRQNLFLTLKSTQAVGAWSFSCQANRETVNRLVGRFAGKYAIRVISSGNAGNHLHLHLKVPHPTLYPKFIRGLSAALAFAITGHSRWNKVLTKPFFDQRPHSRIVHSGRKAYFAVEAYNCINEMEGYGIPRADAEAAIYGTDGGFFVVGGDRG